MPSANTLPVRIRLAALTMSSGRMWLSVPIWSSLPQRPQFLSLSVASPIACFPTLMSIVPFPSIPRLRGVRIVTLLARHVHRAFDLHTSERAQDPLGRHRHGGDCRGAERPQPVIDRIHDRARRPGGARLAGALGAE